MPSFTSFTDAFEYEREKLLEQFARNMQRVGMQFLQDNTIYIPRDTSTLDKTGAFEVIMSDSFIKMSASYTTVYAKKVYYETALTGELEWMHFTMFLYMEDYLKILTTK